MYISMLPARNNARAPYNNVLKSPGEMYFSEYAKIPNAEKPTATKVKYNFFRLLILSLGLILSLSALIERAASAAGAYVPAISKPSP